MWQPAVGTVPPRRGSIRGRDESPYSKKFQKKIDNNANFANYAFIVNINDPDLHRVGAALTQYAGEEAEFSARGIIDELFPYIYQASRRMSTRAISRWLEKGPKIKLSAVSIAKALRNPEKYWQGFAEFIEPQARIVQDALDWPMEKFLYNQEGFEHVVSDSKTAPKVNGDSNDEIQWSIAEYENAVGFLKDKWFSLEPAVRDHCWKYFQPTQEEEK
jgi:hypothetical protein